MKEREKEDIIYIKLVSLIHPANEHNTDLFLHLLF